MPTLTISSQCTLSGLTDRHIVDGIKKALTVKNPDYLTAIRLGHSTWHIEENLVLAAEDMRPDGTYTVTFPREARRVLDDLIKKSGAVIVDNRLKLPPVQFNAPAVENRDYQARAINLAALVGSGVEEVPCGGGKTNIAMGIVHRLQQPTLWLTHKKDLLEQSMDRAIALLGLDGGDVGTITEGRVELGGKMTFATVQTLAAVSYEAMQYIAGRFGLVIVDECHHLFQTPAQVTMFAKVVNALPAYYRIGITATANRSDGLEATMHWLLGPKIFSQPYDGLSDWIMLPEVKRLNTAYEYIQPDGVMFSYAGLIADMTENEERNAFLLNTIKALAPVSHMLVLSNRVEHVENLTAWLGELVPEYKPRMVHGGTKMPERKAIYEGVKKGVCRILVSTYELAKEGLDLPVLDTLVLATPARDETLIKQAVGRIMRTAEGKKNATVVDIVDKKIKTCKGQWYSRRRVYNEMKLKITEVGK